MNFRRDIVPQPQDVWKIIATALLGALLGTNAVFLNLILNKLSNFEDRIIVIETRQATGIAKREALQDRVQRLENRK